MHKQDGHEGIKENKLNGFEKELIDYCKSFVGQEVSTDKSKNTFNCSTFVRFVYRELLGIDIADGGYGIPLTAKIMTSPIGENNLISESATIDEKIDFINENANVGDVLFFHRQSLKDSETTETNFYPGHVGLYIGDGKYIDARYNRGDVSIVDIENDNYLPCFVGIKSMLSSLNYDEQDFENCQE